VLKDADPEFLLAAIRIVHAGSAVIAAVLVGLVLGSFYFWAGARSLLASISGSPGLVLPAIPLGLLAIVASGAAVLTLVAFVVPSRRATRIAPVATLAVE
jgi:putative ABC transport system permease protein